MTGLWLINGWRQQCGSRKQVLLQLQQAKALGFDSYCMQRIGQHWWLCCAPLGARQQQQHDLVAALRQQFQMHNQLLALLPYQQQLLCVSWDQQQLLCAIAVNNDASGQQQLLLVLRGLQLRSRFHPLLLTSADLPDCLLHCQQQFGSTEQQLNLAQLKPSKSSLLLSLNQPPSWRRRRQLLLASVSVISLIAALSWHFWPSQRPPQTMLDSAVVAPQLVGAGVDVLLLVREQLQQLELLAGWHLQQLSLSGAQMQVELSQDYGRFGELQQQLQPHWQLAQAGQQVQLTRNFMLLNGDLQFAQNLDDAEQQLQQQVQQLFPEGHWQLGSAGHNSHYQWQDVRVNFSSWYWLELTELQQLLQGFDVRVLQLQLRRQPQQSIALQLRIYQPLSQGDDDDSTMDVSAGI